MNLRDLRYLVALADTRHFGKAAARCFVSQPTLSAQIKKLEEYLGVELIERQPRQVVLTDAGNAIVPLARQALEASDAIVSYARNDSDPLAGELRVGLIPTIAPYLLPHVMRKLTQTLPQLRLFLYEHQTSVLTERVRGGDIDVGILALPIVAQGLASAALYEEQFTVAVPKQHPLSAQPHVELNDLSGESLLLLEDGHCLRDQALEVCSRVDMEHDDNYRATSLETLRQMVASGYGITLMPELATRGTSQSNQELVIKAFAPPAPTRIVGATWRKSSTRTPAIEAICKVISETMRAELA
jgi:LysR family hydrogen peroxide-inducible transcriptional activator